MKKIIYSLPLMLCLACSSGEKPNEDAFLKSVSNTQLAPKMDAELIGGLLGQIPSPLEISALLKASGTKYDRGFLNKPRNYDRYNTSYKQALNLGIYGTDLGYTNIYEQNLDGIKYLSAIKQLADELKIGQFFDIETIGKLAANSNNLDSLLLVTTQNFNSINQYLQTQDRSNLSVLLLIGGWIEAMDITCQVAKNDMTNKQLHETIGSQKITLEQIMLLLSFYEHDNNINLLLADLEDLKTAFDNIQINYRYEASSIEIVDGVAVVKDNSTTTINITEEDIISIRSKTSAIRNKIIS